MVRKQSVRSDPSRKKSVQEVENIIGIGARTKEMGSVFAAV